MNKAMILEILAWLDAASTEDIEAKRKHLIDASRQSTSSRKSDLNFALRLVDEELISRSEVMKFVKRQG